MLIPHRILQNLSELGILLDNCNLDISINLIQSRYLYLGFVNSYLEA
jgi:hypothetical protein